MFYIMFHILNVILVACHKTVQGDANKSDIKKVENLN